MEQSVTLCRGSRVAKPDLGAAVHVDYVGVDGVQSAHVYAEGLASLVHLPLLDADHGVELRELALRLLGLLDGVGEELLGRRCHP